MKTLVDLCSTFIANHISILTSTPLSTKLPDKQLETIIKKAGSRFAKEESILKFESLNSLSDANSTVTEIAWERLFILKFGSSKTHETLLKKCRERWEGGFRWKRAYYKAVKWQNKIISKRERNVKRKLQAKGNLKAGIKTKKVKKLLKAPAPPSNSTRKPVPLSKRPKVSAMIASIRLSKHLNR